MGECQGDKIAGYTMEAECYRLHGCQGCEKCIIPCTGCSNCPVWPEKARNPEPGDWVVVQPPILDLSYKGKWVDTMNAAVGRIAWVKKGNPIDGYSLKFSTTKKEILDQFLYPLSSMRLAMENDVVVDKMIKTAVNEDM